MKVKAKHMLPLILDFAEEFLSESDFEFLKSSLDKKNASKFKKNILVKQGGLKSILECYFKHNKDVYKKFCKKVEDDSDSEEEADEKVLKKRKRADSNMSLRSDKSKTITKSRKSSGEW